MSDLSRSGDRPSVSQESSILPHALFLHPRAGVEVEPRPFPPRSLAPTPEPALEPASETFAGLIHDARNMVMALELYCDLLDEPGVLAIPFLHYARELRLVSGASRRMMETLSRLSANARQTDSGSLTASPESPWIHLLASPDSPRGPVPHASRHIATTAVPAEYGNGVQSAGPPPTALSDTVLAGSSNVAAGSSHAGEMFWPKPAYKSRKPIDAFMDRSIDDLASELRANHNLLSALAGPGVRVSLSIAGGNLPISMAPEDLTRVLVNLVRNAVEAMPRGGEVSVTLEESSQFLALTFADSGPGIPRDVLDKVFSPGYSSHASHREDDSARKSERQSCAERVDLTAPAQSGDEKFGADASAWPVQHRGLGLSIVRAIVTASGGTVWASNRSEEHSAISNQLDAARHEHGRRDPAKSDAANPGLDSGGAVIHIEFPNPFPDPVIPNPVSNRGAG
jgi:signal transduction histidine kinase